MKGYIKRHFTDAEVNVIRDVHTHYKNIKDNFKPEDYMIETTTKGWFGRVKVKKSFNENQVKLLCGDYLHLYAWDNYIYLYPSSLFEALIILVRMLVVSEDNTVYLSEDLAYVVRVILGDV